MMWLFVVLVLGTVCYLMFRFSFRPLGARKGYGSQGQSTVPRADSRDPVCGMEVASGQGFEEEFKGHQYRFCSKNCQEKFDANRDQYVSPS